MNKHFLDMLDTVFSVDEKKKFLSRIKQPTTQSLHLNTLKNSSSTLLEKIDLPLKQSALHPNMFYYHHEHIGKTWEYHTGIIYPQELSAGIAPFILNPKEKSVILDMCCAPGGKSLQLANICHDQAILLLNEYDYNRAKITVSNLEKAGIANYALYNVDTKNLATEFFHQVDYCLVDAPCSGEGIIRRKEDLLESYNPMLITQCVKRQIEILENAYQVLKEGAYLVYSTCTYNKQENEEMVYRFLTEHPDMELLEIKHPHKRRGIPYKDLAVEKLLRFTILDETEGQFIALFQKKGEVIEKSISFCKSDRDAVAERFIRDNLDIDQYFLKIRDGYVYLKLTPFLHTKLNSIREGVFIGRISNKQFLPEHHLYRCNALKDKFRYTYQLNDQEYKDYVRGYELDIKLENHYYSIQYKGELLGFGKMVNGKLKNKYPKGLRLKDEDFRF